MKKTVFYFSPTGSTKRVIEALTSAYCIDEFVDCSQIMESSKHDIYTQDDLCFFAVCCFGGRVPEVALQRFRQIQTQGAKVVLVVVYGNREFDDALLELEDELQQIGFQCVGAVVAIAQHSIASSVATGRPDCQDVEQLTQLGKQLIQQIEAGLDKVVEVPGHRPYREYKGIPLKPKVNRHCTGCGLCATLCPTGAIDPTNPKQTDLPCCISCMRCIHVCPHQARTLNSMMLAGATLALKKSCSTRKPIQFWIGR